MIRPTILAAKRDWRVYPWPPLAWLETGIKLLALGLGCIAVVESVVEGHFALPSGARLLQLGLLSALSLGLLAAIADRLQEREIVSMGFVVLNNAGHWGMVLALASTSTLTPLFVPFCALMLSGDLVKLVFVQVHQFGVRQYSPRLVQTLTGVYAAGYAALLVLATRAA